MNIDFDKLKHSLTGEYEEVMLEKQLEEKDKEIERLHSIINEVREYILNTKMFTYGEEKEFFLKDYWYGKELLEILDKEN